MKTSTKNPSVIIVLATGLALLGPASAADFVYFHEGTGFSGGISRGLYNYDTPSQSSTFRTSVPSSAGRLHSLDVRSPIVVVDPMSNDPFRTYRLQTTP
jgi:hypothetical protein